MIGQGTFSGSESSLRIWRAGVDESGRVCGGLGGVGVMAGLVGSVGGILGISGTSGGFCCCCSWGISTAG
jgi:hypothetical protein